jgi:hypothetical protein
MCMLSDCFLRNSLARIFVPILLCAYIAIMTQGSMDGGKCHGLFALAKINYMIDFRYYILFHTDKNIKKKGTMPRASTSN